MLKLTTLLLRPGWRTGFVCSSLVHLALAMLLAIELFALLSLDTFAEPAAVTFAAPEMEAVPADAVLEVAAGPSEPWMTVSAHDLTDLVNLVDDPRWSAALLEANSETKSAESSGFISSELLQVIAAAEAKSEEANLDRLESLADQLTDVSSAESIERMKASLQSWLGTSERATQPADKPVEGDFDFGTAQLHDVLRDDTTGEVRYTAVLLDAAGRTVESSLTEAEGESVYRVMQLMKGNPLLEQVYRGIVLSFLDKLLKQRSQ